MGASIHTSDLTVSAASPSIHQSVLSTTQDTTNNLIKIIDNNNANY
jgi:hypothetical protein